jgi:hypothetical protein
MAKTRDRATVVACWCAALLMAQFVGGRAIRDALYLAHMQVATLPAAVMTSAVASILLAFVWSRVVARRAPARCLAAVLVAGGALFIAEWLLFLTLPRVAAVMVYVQVTVLGPLVGSGLWLVASERFDPRTARTAFARMVSAGAAGGLAGGLITERVAAVWGPFRVLWLLSVAAMFAAYAIHRLGAVATTAPSSEPRTSGTHVGVGVLAGAPILRSLAALVLLSAVSAALLDFLFKSEAVASLGSGPRLLQFFAWYYAAAGVLMVVVQRSLHEVALEKLGLARTVMAPAVAVVAGGLGALVSPGIAGITVVRGAESIFRGSLFRSAYEIFFTPVPAAEKRAAKSVIDVGVDRLGEAVGAGLVLVVAGFPAHWHNRLLLTLALVTSIGVVVVARRLTRGYVVALERSLRDHAVALPLTDVRDRTTRAVLWQTMTQPPSTGALTAEAQAERAPGAVAPANIAVFDQDLLQIMALRSGVTERIARVLDPRNPLTPTLVAHVVALLDSPSHAGLAAQALTAAAHQHAGALTDALLDERRSSGLRRRLARVLAENPSARAVNGLLAALSSDDVTVRVQCGRSLARIHATSPALSIDERTVIAAILAELSPESAEWERHRPMLHAEDDESGFLDEHVRQRAHQGLAHVFALLSTILAAEPLRIAYRGLHTDDNGLRGTALEYLETVLPKEIREALWPFIGDGRLQPSPVARRTDALTRLVDAHPSILVNLQQNRVR